MSLATGAELGPFQITEKLGSGGMGDVYRARDSRLGRDVAIKVLPDHLTHDQEALARFQRESTAVAAFSHPNIRGIFDVGTEEGRTFAVMELLEGQTLSERLEAQPLDWRTTVKIGRSIADGLAAAHAKGIIHRDIKPANIFLTNDGQVKILDFGIARQMVKGELGVDTAPTLATQAGATIGTVQYMSPEQVRGERADERSDIFALGCVIFEMLSGQRLFSRGTPADAIAAILHDEAGAQVETATSAPRELQRIILHCLEKSPVRRFQSARDVTFALEGVTETGTQSISSGAEGTRTQAATQSKPSVAILPFANMSADKENEYFSDGLAEELLNNLSKIHDLQVASRTSSFAFKGKNEDIRTIAERLNVQHLLEGSVRKAGSRLRVTAQLVSAADGYHLWSETYDRQLEDVFAVQDEIAQSIAKALRVVLTDHEKDQLGRLPTKDVKAYDLYLQGKQALNEWGGDGLRKARKMFQRAADLDPDFAGAHAGFADACSQLHIFCEPRPEYATEANASSLKAIELAPDLPESHVARGTALYLNKNFDGSRREFQTALKLNADHFDAHYHFGRSLFGQGLFEEAAKELESASEIDADDVSAPSHLAMCYERLDRNEDADRARRKTVDAAERFLELMPDDPRALYLASIDLIALGETGRGLEWAERALELKPYEQSVCYNVACAHAKLGNADRAIELLERTVLSTGFGVRDWIERDPDLDAIRDDLRFHALLKRLEERETMRQAQTES